MTLKIIQKKADSFGLDTDIVRLTDGNDGLFISLETVVDGTARMIDRIIESNLFKYLGRYKIAYQYRGHYRKRRKTPCFSHGDIRRTSFFALVFAPRIWYNMGVITH